MDTKDAADGLEVLKDAIVPVVVESGLAIPAPGFIPACFTQLIEAIDRGFNNVGHGAGSKSGWRASPADRSLPAFRARPLPARLSLSSRERLHRLIKSGRPITG